MSGPKIPQPQRNVDFCRSAFSLPPRSFLPSRGTSESRYHEMRDHPPFRGCRRLSRGRQECYSQPEETRVASIVSGGQSPVSVAFQAWPSSRCPRTRSLDVNRTARAGFLRLAWASGVPGPKTRSSLAIDSQCGFLESLRSWWKRGCNRHRVDFMCHRLAKHGLLEQVG